MTGHFFARILVGSLSGWIGASHGWSLPLTCLFAVLAYCLLCLIERAVRA